MKADPITPEQGAALISRASAAFEMNSIARDLSRQGYQPAVLAALQSQFAARCRQLWPAHR